MKRSSLASLFFLSALVLHCDKENNIDQSTSTTTVGNVCGPKVACADGACAFGFCRSACKDDSDCANSGVCLSDGTTKACRLPLESKCSASTPCPAGLTCGADGSCRTPCDATRPCEVQGQSCQQGTCITPGGTGGAGGQGGVGGSSGQGSKGGAGPAGKGGEGGGEAGQSGAGAGGEAGEGGEAGSGGDAGGSAGAGQGGISGSSGQAGISGSSGQAGTSGGSGGGPACDPVLGGACCDGDCGATKGMVCESEVCACDLGATDCDGKAETGCEAQLLSDGKNCGACGHDCGGGACVAGTCQPHIIVEAGMEEGQAYLDTWVPHGPGSGTMDFSPFDAAGAVLPVFVPATGKTQLRAFDPDGKAGKILTSEAEGTPIRFGPWITPNSVFWHNSASLTLSRVARSGGAMSEPVNLVSPVEEVHVDSGALYFRVGGLFQRIPSGTLATTTGYASQPTFVRFAVLGEAMFFIEAPKLLEGSVTGGALQTRYAAFVPAGCSVSLLADAGAVYGYGACTNKTGWIGRYDRGTGAFVELLKDDPTIKEITYMVVDGPSLYMVDNGSPYQLLTMPSGGGPVKVLSQEGPFYGLGHQGTFLYSWRQGSPNPSGYLRVAKP